MGLCLSAPLVTHDHDLAETKKTTIPGGTEVLRACLKLFADHDDHAEAETTIPGGADALRACFLICLKLDIYQPKYANISMNYKMKPCPVRGPEFVEGYGIGTVFEGTNMLGQPEIVTIKELVSLEKIVSESRGTLITYSFSLLPNGDCKLQYAMDGPRMKRWEKGLVKQVDTLGSFVKANVRAILDEASALPGPAPGGAFCEGCGAANSGGAFCVGCGAPAGGVVAGGGGFVEVEGHAQAQQSQQALMVGFMNTKFKVSGHGRQSDERWR